MTCDNETSPRGAGNTVEGSNPEIAYTIGGLGMSLPMDYTSRTARGAASEMLASAHLMAQGYHVFRALASACPFDLIAYRTGEPPLRVEVKSGVNFAPGTYNSPNFSTPTNDEWDLLAVVSPDGQVVMLPKMDRDGLRAGYLAALGLSHLRQTADSTHCRRGHEYTDGSFTQTARGRTCRICQRARAAKAVPSPCTYPNCNPAAEESA